MNLNPKRMEIGVMSLDFRRLIFCVTKVTTEEYLLFPTWTLLPAQAKPQLVPLTFPSLLREDGRTPMNTSVL